MLNDDDWLQRLTSDAILARSIAGQRALTVQDYTSVNVKTGYQRIISKLFPSVAVGTSEGDINTFRSADCTDGISNYSVAHTMAVEQIMEYFAQLPAELQAGVVFPTMGVSAEGIQTLTGSDMSKIQVFVDAKPFTVFSMLGLSRLE